MGLKNLTADLSNFHNINQKKVDRPVGDFEKTFHPRRNRQSANSLA